LFTPAGARGAVCRDLGPAADGRPAAPSIAVDEPVETAAAPAPSSGRESADRETTAGSPADVPGSGPSFFDLVAVLAEPVPLYLGDAPLPDGQSAENMEAARFHIDLLDVLRQKTAGNLSTQESAVLEDILYRLRMRFVQKRG
jgi:hypothetical protein